MIDLVTPPSANTRAAYYESDGDFTSCVLEPGALFSRSPLVAAEATVAEPVGENTFVQCGLAELEQLWGSIEAALSERPRGTRVSVVVPSRLWEPSTAAERSWRARPFRRRRLPTSTALPFGEEGLERRELHEDVCVLAAGLA